MWEMLIGIAYVRWAIFAAVGGIIGYLIRSESINARDFIIETLGAGFMGLLVAMACTAYNLSTPITGVLVGVSALAGARATLTAMERLIKRRLNLPETSDEANGKAP
jgi:urea transporter